MGQRTNAAVIVAQTTLRKEACAKGMEQRSNDQFAAVKDAQIESSKGECASGMGHIRSLMKNLPHFHYQMNQHSMKQPSLFPTNAQTQLRVFKMQVSLLPV